MQVDDVLNKVVNDQPSALAVMVRHDGRDYQNLQPPYDMIAAGEVLETVSDMFSMTDTLEDEGQQITDMVFSFDEHALVSRRIAGGGTVSVLAHALARPQLIKLQVALGLYVRALEKALAETEDDQTEIAPIDTETTLSVPAQTNGMTRSLGQKIGNALFGGKMSSDGPTEDEIAAAIKAGKKVRHYRGQAYIE